ncbi:MAG TPA: GNAT family N-acetyltransferase, partial [Dysgonomonas sp.]|nr:GNAT family N-acetyltransferase [Dysgonomonas sp.]
SALDDAKEQGKDGIIAIVGSKKMHFMADGKWLLRQEFEIVQSLPYGFELLVKKINPDAENPTFKESVLTGECPDKKGLVVYYSDRCPYTDYHINVSLKETAQKRNLPLKVIKLTSAEEAQSAPTPATIFSLFYNGKFVTTDISVCMDSRFDKIVKLD